MRYFILGFLIGTVLINCTEVSWLDAEYWYVLDYGNKTFVLPDDVWTYIDNEKFKDKSECYYVRTLQEAWDSEDQVDCLLRSYITLAIWYDYFHIKGKLVLCSTDGSSDYNHAYPEKRGFYYQSGRFNEDNCRTIKIIQFDDIKNHFATLK